MTYEEFKADVMKAAERRPSFIRKGQAVFNIVDTRYQVARNVQFQDGIDCYYRDDNIEPFLRAAWKYAKPNFRGITRETQSGARKGGKRVTKRNETT